MKSSTSELGQVFLVPLSQVKNTACSRAFKFSAEAVLTLHICARFPSEKEINAEFLSTAGCDHLKRMMLSGYHLILQQDAIHLKYCPSIVLIK